MCVKPVRRLEKAVSELPEVWQSLYLFRTLLAVGCADSKGCITIMNEHIFVCR